MITTAKVIVARNYKQTKPGTKHMTRLNLHTGETNVLSASPDLTYYGWDLCREWDLEHNIRNRDPCFRLAL